MNEGRKQGSKQANKVLKPSLACMSLYELWKQAAMWSTQSACNYVHKSLSKRQSQPKEPAWTHPACVSVMLLPTPLAHPRTFGKTVKMPLSPYTHQPPGISVLAGARLLGDNLPLDISLIYIYERSEPAQENPRTMCKTDIDTETAGDNDLNTNV